MTSDIGMLNWRKMKEDGFEFLIFDKENTLLKPN